MRLFCIILIIQCFSIALKGQVLVSNACDSLDKKSRAYERCMLDSVYSNDIIRRINYHVLFTTKILPQFRKSFRFNRLPAEVQTYFETLRTYYDSTWQFKKSVFLEDARKNSQFGQPKSFINLVLALEEFGNYPDSYAFLINPIHLTLIPKTIQIDLESISQFIQKIYLSIPEHMHRELRNHVRSLRKQKQSLLESLKITEMFQGDITDERYKYDLMDFLLWISRKEVQL